MLIASFAAQDDDEPKDGDTREGSANPSRVLGLTLARSIYVPCMSFALGF